MQNEKNYIVIRLSNGRHQKLIELYAHDQRCSPGVKSSYTDSCSKAIDQRLAIASVEDDLATITSAMQGQESQEAKQEKAIVMAIRFYAQFLRNKAEKQKGIQG